MDSDLPVVSIVITNLNGKRWLEKCFPSVFSSAYPKDKTEIILVDNGSNDGSVEFVRSAYGNEFQIKIIRNEKNLGWSPANNQGMETATGEIIVCLSNDMEVDSNWLNQIVKVMKSSPKIGIVQCNSISMLDRKTPDSCMNYLDKFGYSYGYVPGEQPEEVFFAEGMAFAIKRQVIKEIGMLDDYYFMEYDDMDFSWRARLAGYKVFFAPSAKVYHARGGTVGATYFQKLPNITLYVRNHLVTLVKNYELKNLLLVLPVVLAVEIAKTFYFLGKGNSKLAFATFKGLYQTLRDVKLILKKRERIQQEIRKTSDKEVVKYMHPFKPKLLYSYITLQAKGKQFILDAKPPIQTVTK